MTTFISLKELLQKEIALKRGSHAIIPPFIKDNVLWRTMESFLPSTGSRSANSVPSSAPSTTQTTMQPTTLRFLQSFQSLAQYRAADKARNIDDLIVRMQFKMYKKVEQLARTLKEYVRNRPFEMDYRVFNRFYLLLDELAALRGPIEGCTRHATHEAIEALWYRPWVPSETCVSAIRRASPAYVDNAIAYVGEIRNSLGQFERNLLAHATTGSSTIIFGQRGKQGSYPP